MIYSFFLLFITTAYAALGSGSLVDSSTAAAARRAIDDCEPINWHDYYVDIAVANTAVAFMSNSTLIGFFRKYFDDMHIQIDRDEPMVKKVLGTTYVLDTVLADVHISGLKDVKAHPVRVLSHNSLQMGLTSVDVLTINATFHTQYTKQQVRVPVVGWHFCPMEWTFWRQCPTRTLTVDAIMALTNLTADAQVELNVYQCNRQKGFWSALACKFSSGWSYFKSLFDNDNMVNNGVAAEALKRIKSAHVLGVDIQFVSSNVTANIRLDKNVDELGDEVVKDAEMHIKRELTEGFFRNRLFQAANYAAKKTGNAAIRVVEPLFQGSCYRR